MKRHMAVDGHLPPGRDVLSVCTDGKSLTKRYRRWLSALMLLFLFISGNVVHAQQFNSDNYWTAPHGTETSIITVGQNYSLIMVTAALFPKWEFNLGATLYKEDLSQNTTDHFSTNAYVKYMVYENEAKNGGWAVMAGTGANPGYFQGGAVTSSFDTYWASFPITFPFANGDVSWDIMPGFIYNKEYGTTNNSAWGYTYSTRLAVYKVIPQSAIVAEVFGTEGDAQSDAQYKVGVRWESKNVIMALTYGDTFKQGEGAGFEFGVMFLSPQFLCFGPC